MDHEFQLNMQIKNMESEVANRKENNREDRKDQRADRQAQNQQAIKRGESLKKFESAGNDVIGGGLGLERFDPR